jgi:hypothetical protein
MYIFGLPSGLCLDQVYVSIACTAPAIVFYLRITRAVPQRLDLPRPREGTNPQAGLHDSATNGPSLHLASNARLATYHIVKDKTQQLRRLAGSNYEDGPTLTLCRYDSGKVSGGRL